MSLQDYMEDIKDIILSAMHHLDCEEYERFAEYAEECLRGQK